MIVNYREHSNQGQKKYLLLYFIYILMMAPQVVIMEIIRIRHLKNLLVIDYRINSLRQGFHDNASMNKSTYMMFP